MAPIAARASDVGGSWASPPHAAPPPDAVRAGLIAFGLYEVARGVAPVSPCPVSYGGRGEIDRAERTALDLPLGFALLASVRRRSWRSPLLALGSLSWTLRAVRPLTADRRPGRGWSEAVARAKLTLGAGALGWLFSRASRAERWASR